MKSKHPYLLLCIFPIWLAATGMLVGEPASALKGLWTLCTTPAGLVRDSIAAAGPAAAFLCAALVSLMSIAYLRLTKAPVNGLAIGTLGIVSGFALFGKNPFNILPIIIGGWLYSRISRTKAGDTACAVLMSTTLAPVVSFVSFECSHPSVVLGIITGIATGIIVEYIAKHTPAAHKGMTLYNVGFASGLFAFGFNALMKAFGEQMTIVSVWSSDYKLELGLATCGFCLILIALGLFACGSKPGEALKGFAGILKGPADDYLVKDGMAATLVNIGVSGLFVCGVIYFMGGDFSGPVMAGILSVMGFSAKGKSIRYFWPLCAGVLICAAVMPGIGFTSYGVQMAVLFVTAAAPLVSCFGWIPGLFAGFLHCMIVQVTGGVTGGFNLYNNGFALGLTCIILLPMLEAFKNRFGKILAK